MAKKQNNDEKPKLKRKQYEKEMRRLQAETLSSPGMGQSGRPADHACV